MVQSIELLGVKLRMLGAHQLQNAVTATCAALCLNKQGKDSKFSFVLTSKLVLAS